MQLILKCIECYNIASYRSQRVLCKCVYLSHLDLCSPESG